MKGAAVVGPNHVRINTWASPVVENVIIDGKSAGPNGMVKKIVSLYVGGVEVTSAAGQGARFIVSLPLPRHEAASARHSCGG